MTFNIEVNKKEIQARKGETILDALQRNGINVPTLCHMPGLNATGACRMCVVEVEGRGELLPACSQPVEEWMKIRTHSPRVIRARRTLLELLLANHPDDCLYCSRNGNCELQRLAGELNVTERRFTFGKISQKLDISSPGLVRDPSKCILCNRCIRTCEEVMGVATLDFIKRGIGTAVATAFNKPVNLSNCIHCGQCIMVCPAGALAEGDQLHKVQEALHDPELQVVIQCSPTTSVTMAEAFDNKNGKDIQAVINAALRKIGFAKVYDTGFAADINIMEVAHELHQRIIRGERLPLITGCCPAWVKYAEQYFPDQLSLLSECTSPQQIMGSLIKSDIKEIGNVLPEKIFSVSVMPCVAKKFEARREEMSPQGITRVDAVITNRELARLIRLNGIDINQVEPSFCDNPFGSRSSAGKLYGVSGGVAEAILRTLYFLLCGEESPNLKLQKLRGSKTRKELKMNVGEHEIGVVVVSTMIQAAEIMNEIANGRNDIHLVEVMACPGGCINGGGQPFPGETDTLSSRSRILYEIDDKESVRVAHKNAAVLEIYDQFLGEPGGEKARKLFRTTFNKRTVLL